MTSDKLPERRRDTHALLAGDGIATVREEGDRAVLLGQVRRLEAVLVLKPLVYLHRIAKYMMGRLTNSTKLGRPIDERKMSNRNILRQT